MCQMQTLVWNEPMLYQNQKVALPSEALPYGKSLNEVGTIPHLFGKT